ncbi:nuclear transport factor 2 family protein [Iodidimonas sp. SYSU 1G8]|uniref:nuclear transport factor 2 family protein n=1 Tax=Iodidimonas sp. SYSU 1G8 TaxID=3133967 RepID=UPI0031FE576E
MSAALEAALRDVADKHAIEQVLVNHGRGIDRSDTALMQECYHADATVDYGLFKGPAHEFAALVTGAPLDRPLSTHRTSNIWIRVEGDKAIAESYGLAYREEDDEESRVQRLMGGRYLDRLERRGGAWKITQRIFVLDWNINLPCTLDLTGPLFAGQTMGGRRADDPATRLFADWSSRHAPGTPSGHDAASRDAVIDRAVSKQALHELNTAYCRAADRADDGLMRRLWHPGAKVSYGEYSGGFEGFCDYWAGVRDRFERITHLIGNDYFEIDGDRAVGETLVARIEVLPRASGTVDRMIGGRFLDRFERRGGVWKLSGRAFVLDWNVNRPTTAIWDRAVYASLPLRGGRAPEDPVYALWGA